MQQPPIELSYVEFVSECEVVAVGGRGRARLQLRVLGCAVSAAAAMRRVCRQQQTKASLFPSLSYSCGILQLEKW